MLRDELERLKATINTTWVVAHNVDGSQTTGSLGDGAFIHGTLAEQPTTLDASNDGLLFYVNDYGHVVRFNAGLNAWEFAPGDNGAGYFQDFAITPQAPGWALCDGSTVNYLVVGGAALATGSIALPNLTGTLAYRKSAAAYTGAINAKGGSSGTGTTGTGTTGGQSSGHTHNFSATTGVPSGTDSSTATPAFGSDYASPAHTHDLAGTTSGASNDHTHSAPALSIPALGVGSIEMANLGVLPYFRR